MSILSRLLQSLLRTIRRSALEILPPHVEPLLESIEDLAGQQRRPSQDVAADLLFLAREQRQARQFYVECWENLTEREKEVTALICLGYSNPEISDQLGISVSTVKTHVHHVLSKYGFRSRKDLQAELDHWDFENWFNDRS